MEKNVSYHHQVFVFHTPGSCSWCRREGYVIEHFLRVSVCLCCVFSGGSATLQTERCVNASECWGTAENANKCCFPIFNRFWGAPWLQLHLIIASIFVCLQMKPTGQVIKTFLPVVRRVVWRAARHPQGSWHSISGLRGLKITFVFLYLWIKLY